MQTILTRLHDKGAASLALLGFTLVGQSPLLAASGHWSDDASLRHADPVRTPIAVAALGALACCAISAGAAGRVTLRPGSGRVSPSAPRS